MKKFIPREKLSKKARRRLDASERATWMISPTTRASKNKKLYDRNNARNSRIDCSGRCSVSV